DGFSPGQGLFTYLAGATAVGLPAKNDVAMSLTNFSPTVLLEADTGARVPHFAELDMSTSTASQRLLMIRPVVRLRNQARYIVAIRRVVGRNGQPIPASDVFTAIKMGQSSPEHSVDLRRDLYTDIFALLAAAGVAKDDLQIAWDFSVSSDSNMTRSMLAM